MDFYSNNQKDHLVIRDCPRQLVQIDKMDFITIIQMGFFHWILQGGWKVGWFIFNTHITP
jgi:hypothetical protein